jgi:hypothetical protein
MSNDITELRAALIQLAKTLETERACVLRIVAIVERQVGMVQQVTISERDSITGTAGYNQETITGKD